jgi:hopanoid biosynthesis associated RND transporter like protein HpnN
LNQNSIVLVGRSPLADAADAAATVVAEQLREDSGAVDSVFSGSVDEFFITNGLLYQSVEELDSQLYKPNSAASTIGFLRENQNLQAFFESLYSAGKLAEKAEFDPKLLDQLYGRVADNIASRLAGEPRPFSWQAAFDAGDEADAETTRIIMVSPRLDFGDLQPAETARADVLAAVDAVPQNLRALAEIEVTGDPILRYEELTSVRDGILLSLIVSVLLCALLLIFCYRSFARAGLTVAALFVTLALATGFAALAVGTLNLVSVAFVVLLVGLGVDFTIHALAHIEESSDRRDIRKSLIESGRSIGMALALSALTTAAAFLAFVPTDFIGMSQLGILGAGGVMIAFFVAITFIPAVIMLMPRLATAHLWSKRPARPSEPAGRLSLRARPLHLALACLFLGVAGAAAFIAPEVRFEADPMQLRDPASPSMQAVRKLNADPDTSAYRINLIRDDREAALALAERLEDVEGVHEVQTLDSFVPKNQDVKLQAIDLAYPTLESLVTGEGLDLADLEPGESALEALLAQLRASPTGEGGEALAEALTAYASANTSRSDAALERDIFRFFPALIDRFRSQLGIDEVTIEALPADVRDRFLSADGRWRVEVSPEENLTDTQALERFVKNVSAVDPAISGAPAQIAGAGEVVSSAMLQAALIAAFMVGLICFLAVRKLSTVLAILVPLIASGTIIAAASVLAGIPFNYANVIVLPLVIGLGVDSGIHLALRRAGSGTTEALFSSSTPRAVVFSGMTTIVAFASLALSTHRGTASMGELLSISIVITLAGTLALTPFLMDLFQRFRPSALTGPEEEFANERRRG